MNLGHRRTSVKTTYKTFAVHYIMYITHHIYFVGSMWLFATALAIIVCSTRAEDGEQEESNRAEKRKNFKII